MRPLRARTFNDNGAGAESSPSTIISVGRPIAPDVTATGSASGVEVSFTPDAASLLTTDSFRYWAVGSDGTTQRLAEAAVGAVTVGEGASIGLAEQPMAWVACPALSQLSHREQKQDRGGSALTLIQRQPSK